MEITDVGMDVVNSSSELGLLYKFLTNTQ